MTVDETWLGIDIGGTTTVAVAITPTGDIAGRASASTPAAEGPERVLDVASALARDVAGDSVRRVGVGSTGVIDPASGRVVAATSAMPGWLSTDIGGGLRTRLGATAAVCNDVQAFAVAELAFGAARGMRSALVVTVGTGIGGAVVIDGSVVLGANFAAGHVGHVPSADAVGVTCPCGGTGHVEAVASGPAMLAAYHRLGRSAADLRDVASAARDGDQSASAVLATGGAALGRVLGGLVSALDPEAVVVGGGVVAAGDPFMGPLRSAVASSTLPALAGVPVRTTTIGPDAVAVGAAVVGQRPLVPVRDEPLVSLPSMGTGRP